MCPAMYPAMYPAMTDFEKYLDWLSENRELFDPQQEKPREPIAVPDPQSSLKL